LLHALFISVSLICSPS